MKFETKLYLKTAFVLVFGASLLALGLFKNESFISMGTAMLAVGVLLLIKTVRLSKDKERLFELKNSAGDERLRFVEGKSCLVAFYFSIICEFIAACVFTFLNMEQYAFVMNMTVCFGVLAYLFSWIYNSKKF